MPLSRPSLQALVQRIAGDVQSRLPGADALLRRSNLGVLTRITAGVAHGLYGFLEFISRQVIIDTAESEYLERWAAVWGLVRNAAVRASGELTFTGSSGFTVPAGTLLQRADGQQYTTLEAVTLSGGTGSVAVQASVAGAEGATVAGSVLVLTTPILGINSAATVQAPGLTGASDLEADADLRRRLLFRIRRPPQGGSASDYENWCYEVPGVTRVWVKPLYLGAGTVGIFFVRDNDDGSILPDVDEVNTVQAYLELRRPVTADVTVLAPIALPIDFTIELTPDTGAVRDAVQAELADVISREGEPGGTIFLSHLREAISLAAGEVNHVLTDPVADVVAPDGSMPVLGAITWA